MSEKMRHAIESRNKLKEQIILVQEDFLIAEVHCEHMYWCIEYISLCKVKHVFLHSIVTLNVCVS